jgi:AcrR family transcriptional regulator
MNELPPFLDDPADTQEEILKATYAALCTHGYSDITIQRIGDEFPKSKSLLYHHYDGKDDLLRELLDYMIDQAEEMIPWDQGTAAEERIDVIVDHMFGAEDIWGDVDFSRALVELRAQAAHDDQYREHFTRSDRFVRKAIESIVRSGVEDGSFQSVDPAQTAAMFQVMGTGTMTQRVTNDDPALEECRAEFERYVRDCLLAE